MVLVQNLVSQVLDLDSCPTEPACSRKLEYQAVYKPQTNG